MNSMSAAQAEAHTRVPAWLLVSIVAVIGLNLRATLGAIPPLLDSIGEDLALSATTAALLTSVPVLCMGLFAPVSQFAAARIGAEGTAAVLLGVLAAGSLMRLWVGSMGTLLFSTALAGIGMGGISSLMPGLIAHHLPRIPGTTTGVYSMAMASGVAVAAWIAGPTADLLGGWRPALALWGLAAGVTALCWSALLSRLTAAAPRRPLSRQATHGRIPWHSSTARWITTFTTLNMLIGFSGVAWIAPTFVHHGFSPQRAASLFALFQIIQLGAMLVLPLLTDFTRDRRPLLTLTVVCTGTGLCTMALAPIALAFPAVMLFGTGVGGASALALVLIQDATSTQLEAGRLSAMVLSVAFVAGAVGPLLLGSMRDLTGGFAAGYGILLLLSATCLAVLPVFRPGRRIDDIRSRRQPLPDVDTHHG